MATRKRMSKQWTADDINQLWNGKMTEVAKKLGRSTGSISVARTQFKRFKPGSPGALVATDDNIKKAGGGGPRKGANKAAKRVSASKSASKGRGGNRQGKTYDQPVNQPARNYKAAFSMTYNGQILELQQSPKSIKLDKNGLELGF